jgi:hypothetical protein
MGVETFFGLDAANWNEDVLAQLPAHGGAAVQSFCGTGNSKKDWEDRGVCVLRARKGFGKSHLLLVRSRNHRNSDVAGRTIFYPQVGRQRKTVDSLSSLHAVVPRWLQGKESVDAWVLVWQLSILGLLAWITGAKSGARKEYAEWFGSIEALDQVDLKQHGDVPQAPQLPTMLTIFMGRVLHHVQRDEFKEGMEKLNTGLYSANSDWTMAILSRLGKLNKTRIAMYLDAPDELVELNQPILWRSVQQSLLLAIWKFSKNTIWSGVLNIYASVRSEAFGSGHDHPDVSLAMGLAMSLQYAPAELESILNDKIRQADPVLFAQPLQDGVKPVHALCGFEKVVHDNRSTLDGKPYEEDIFVSILRHTRQVPREVVAIGGAIYAINGAKTTDTVRKAVNARASQNIQDAIGHSFLGWDDAVHKSFAIRVRKEAMDANSLGEIANQFGSEGPRIIKFFVRHGLLGIAEPQPQRHRHYYQQSFAYDEIHGQDEASSINKDYFLVHPAFKEWIMALPEQLNTKFERITTGVIGDLEPYEALQPIVRLTMSRGEVQLDLRFNNRRLAAGAHSHPLIFLYIVLWACRETKRTGINFAEFMAIWDRLKNTDRLKNAVRLPMPRLPADVSKKLREWQKKINLDPEVKNLYRAFSGGGSHRAAQLGKGKSSIKRSVPFLSVSAKSHMGANAEITIPSLKLEEIDWDQELYATVMNAQKK